MLLIIFGKIVDIYLWKYYISKYVYKVNLKIRDLKIIQKKYNFIGYNI